MDLQKYSHLLQKSKLNPSRYGEIGLFNLGKPNIGGNIKENPEDFIVEEIPSYQPCGSGDHLFLWIEKKLLSADELVSHISRQLNISSRDVGVAGKKDRVAVTRQFISVPKKVESKLSAVDSDSVKILSVKPHPNKLTIGHLQGNFFNIIVRDIQVKHLSQIEAIFQNIDKNGFPNFFGPQRFGKQRDTAEIGFKILNGDTDKLSKRWLNKTGKKFALSAAQSFLFNRYLLRRMVELGLDKLLDGDVVFKKSGGIFKVEDFDQEKIRFDSGELIPAGPIFGKKTYKSAKAALDFENEILAESNILREKFSEFGKMMLGTRRPIFCFPENFSYSIENQNLTLNFGLKAGSYATVLLSEFSRPSDIYDYSVNL
ncbi:MAG: tRNA pseudouridine(13) synthase TruD [Deltaproteobacteria bacterium]|nr:tRNA pseudouridine(13) synthase TruD [Deltaproteobacteria bacterium]